MATQMTTRPAMSTTWLSRVRVPTTRPDPAGVRNVARHLPSIAVRRSTGPRDKEGLPRGPVAGAYFLRSAAVFMHFAGGCSAFTASHLMVRVVPS